MAPSKPFEKGGLLTSLFARPLPLYALATLLRAVLLLYGLWQDAHSPVKYTDIDYLVFTDAARFVAQSHPLGPYARDTYRYTPLLSWLLLPTAWTHRQDPSHWLSAAYFASGKVLFALADLAAGWLIVKVLLLLPPGPGPATAAMDAPRARRFAAIWLLNPMVATISTRGSSEGLLAVAVVALLWAVLARRVALAAVLLGAGVHFKIYPFIYAPAIVWWMDDERMAPTAMARGKETEEETRKRTSSSPVEAALAFLTPDRRKLAALSLATFAGLNLLMYALYGRPFLVHTFLHHVTRIDHRHNFSPYNVLLYLTSASSSAESTGAAGGVGIESVAFLPQLLLACVLIPLVMAKKDLPATMLAQTWTFVTFNKVCTSQVSDADPLPPSPLPRPLPHYFPLPSCDFSKKIIHTEKLNKGHYRQYFLWYMIFLPLYLPRSSFLRRPKLGVAALALWVLTQAAWLQQGFQLEFLGESTFVPGLWVSSLGFFLANCWILGVVVGDTA